MFDLAYRALVEQKEILFRAMLSAARYENHAEKQWCLRQLERIDALMLEHFDKPAT